MSLLDKCKQSPFFKGKIIFAFVAFVIVYLIWIRNGFFYSSFNLDEVILFFTSRGYFPGEAPEAANSIRPFNQMLFVNRNGGSLDPGLFTAILRYWSLVSLKTYWLRLLPLGFFTLSLYFCFLFSREMNRKSALVLFVPSVLFLNSTLLDYAFTVRPYAMEVCGLCYLAYLILKNYSLDNQKDQHRDQKNGLLHNIYSGLILTFFLGSRYSLFIPVILYYGLEFTFFKRLSKKAFFLQILPVGLGGILFYFLSYRYQVEFLPLRYAQEYFLKNLNQRQVLKLLFGLKSILFYLSLSYLITFKDKKWFRHSKEGQLVTVILVYLLVSVILDMINISPLYLYRRYSLGLQVGLLIITIIVVTDLLTHFEGLKYIVKKEKAQSFIVLTFLAFFTLRVFSYDFRQRSDIVPILKILKEKANSSEVVSCDKVTYEMIKFLRFYNKYKIDWSKLPAFEGLGFKNNGGLIESDYYLTIFGATTIFKPDDVVKKDSSLSLLYKGSYQRLYKR